MLREKLENILTLEIDDLDQKEIWIYGIGNSMDLYQNGLKRIQFKITG